MCPKKGRTNMNEQAAKTVSSSLTNQVHVVLPKDCNASCRLFGGILMQWIDIVAGVVARRHSGMGVTTASVDTLQFLAPAHLGDLISMTGRLTYVGRTSMEVCVDSYVEGLDGKRSHINHAYFVLVAIDKDNTPQPVPRLVLETAEEQAEWDAAERRRETRRRTRG